MLRIGQVEATATQDGKYTDGSVAGGIAATRLRAAAFNAMQEELAHIVESAGLALDINDMTQVLKAIQKLTLSRANPFADIKSDGAAAISTALTNLGLGDIAKAGVGKGVASDNGFFTVPVLIAGVKTEFYVQWGEATVSNSTGVITLPVAFPNKRLLVLANDITESATSVVTFGINTDASKSSFTFFSAIGSSASNAGQFAWLAIGY
ncbi:gp53-like domain-containing protein [Escherichia coli]|uniref:gp53-like domain-containing protein n=2 Tax=Escherichia coli TaxID=562 RepID=UPI002036CFB7|nr:hypothetical protein [Escherichia coli]